jgi:hypothetical protein
MWLQLSPLNIPDKGGRHTISQKPIVSLQNAQITSSTCLLPNKSKSTQLSQFSVFFSSDVQFHDPFDMLGDIA